MSGVRPRECGLLARVLFWEGEGQRKAGNASRSRRIAERVGVGAPLGRAPEGGGPLLVQELRRQRVARLR